MIKSETSRNVRELALFAIDRIESDAAFTDIVISQLLGKNILNPKDRALLNQIVRGVIRMKLHLNWIVNQFLKNPKVPENFRWLMWIAIYQIKFLDKIPDFAAVNESVNLSKKHVGFKWAKVANGVLRNYLRTFNQLKFPSIEENPVEGISVRTSHPRWMVKQWITQFGAEETLQLCTQNNKPPGITVRINKHLVSFLEFEKSLQESGIEFEPLLLDSYYRISNFPNEIKKDWLNTGKISVQDQSAGLVGYLLDPQEGELILDVCAAPGGKSIHAAELSENKATIFASDVSIARAQLIKKDVKRTNNKSVKVAVCNAEHLSIKQADKVLLDAPCSGLGVLQKKPDIRWRRKPDDIKKLTNIQKNLLKNISDKLKVGGALIYSTCTILCEENENVVENFLRDNQNFKLESIKNKVLDPYVGNESYILTFPHKHNMDGSFAAKLVRMA
jgi:16S rRNA (cytosine967-C5)-methyltransferase